MKLNETSKMMVSEDYKERFKAEYLQLKIRKKEIDDMIKKHENGTLTLESTYLYDILREQSMSMLVYLECLQERAKIEDIEL